MKTIQLLATAAVCVAAPAFGQSRQVTTPNTTTAAGTESVVLGGQTFANHGLIGVGRLDANTRDFRGETLGSFSGMALDLKTWRRNADGSYSGVMFTLPDRGPNDVGGIVGTSDYRGRVHRSLLTLRPSTSTAVLPQATTSQNQLTIVPDGGFLFTDTTGANFTGRDPQTSTLSRGGITYPTPPAGDSGAGRISLDAEAIAFRADGSFYVSDEYAAAIYYFDATGRQVGAIPSVAALVPLTGGAINFNSVTPGTVGRRNNQGLEAVAITPDGKRLVTILQSATVQDTNGGNQQTRNNTRLFVYDISTNATPTTPIGHYVLQLPTFTQAGNGGAVDRTAAQSEMLALNPTQFLVLSRDGIGRGSGASATNSPVFKSVLLVDIAGATNLVGTPFETSYSPIATNGVLNTTIVPAAQVQLVNLLNPVQLNRFGMNLNTAPSNSTSLSEKWEAMGLAPVLEESAAQDFFLFVGNDNDFQSATGNLNGAPFNAALTGAGGTGSNDSVILVYRLTLPTYVDPQALDSMMTSAPRVFDATRTMAAELAGGTTNASLAWLSGVRSALGAGLGDGFQMWIQGGWNRADTRTGTMLDGTGTSGGIDYGFGAARIGVSIGYAEMDGNFGLGTSIKGTTTTVAAYGGVAFDNGFYAQAAGGTTLDFRIGRIERLAAYGQSGRGRTGGRGLSVTGEIGWLLPFGPVRVGPFAAADYADVRTDSFAESGASLGNITYSAQAYRRLRTTVGGEINTALGANIRTALRAGYAFERAYGDRTGIARLTSAQHSSATQSFALADTSQDRLTVGGRIDGSVGKWRAGVAAEGRFARGRDEARVSMRIGFAF